MTAPASDPALAASVESAMATAPVDYGGGCSLFKGKLLASLVVSENLATVVEIGVHDGRSLLALGIGAPKTESGRVWGIDPYDASAYLPGQASADIDAWLTTFNFDAAHADVIERLSHAGLADTCVVVRETSTTAARRFAAHSIDLLHIDGDHAEAAVTGDLAAYLPRVRPRGFVVLDDISWPTVRGAAAELQRSSEVVFSMIDTSGRAGLGWNDFSVCRLP